MYEVAPHDNTRCLRLAGLTLTLAAALAPQLVAAQSAPQAAVHEYRIPAGPLAQALSAFAKVAGITVSFRPEDARQLTTAGLDGRDRKSVV